jgi:capsular exopolysaccharide synthesis family protein
LQRCFEEPAVADQPTTPDLPTGPDAPAYGPNPLTAALYRWPILAVALLLGAALGVLLQLTTPPTYQSSAQLLVLKKRTDVVQSGDARVGVLEDVVATQLTVIKSEQTRRSAARELRQGPAADRFPADEAQTAEIIRTGLVVTRDKDSSTPGQVGSGVVNLAYRGPDPVDSRRVLDAIIKVYQGELFARYDKATLEQIATLEKTIQAMRVRERTANEERLKYQAELRRITTEELPSIRARVTAQKNNLYDLQLRVIDLDDQLDLIAKAGNNRRDRLAALAQLTAQSRPGLVGNDPNAPESALRLLEARRKELGEEFGKDHPQVKQVDAQIAFYKDEIRRQNPDDPTGQLDELGAYGKRAAQQKKTAELQIKQIETRLTEDEKRLVDAGTIQDRIDSLIAQARQADQEANRFEGQKAAIQATQGSSGYTAEPITPPGEGIKVAPVWYQSILLGLAVGLMLGFGGLLIAEFTDKSFRSPAEVRRRLGVPVIGHVPQIRVSAQRDPAVPGNFDPVLAAALRPKSAEAEAYRGLRTQLYFSTQGRGHQVIQITSPTPGDGKTTTAANLAVAIAQSGKRTVLVECDFRKPRITKLFRLPPAETGLAVAIAGLATLPSAVHASGIDNLDLIPCGPRPSNPAELLTSPTFQQILADLKAKYDFVILDTPPLLSVSDPAAVAPRADGVLLVLRMSKSARPAAERAREELATLGANLLGVIVNGTAGSRGEGYNYGAGGYRYSDYHYADDYAETK